jgi:hypothetical protein
MRGSCGGFLSSLRQASCRTNHGPGACRCPFQTLAQRRHSERDGPPFADARVWYVASRNFGRRGCCAGSSTEEATVALPPSPTWLRRGTTEGNRGQQRTTEDNRSTAQTDYWNAQIQGGSTGRRQEKVAEAGGKQAHWVWQAWTTSPIFRGPMELHNSRLN